MAITSSGIGSGLDVSGIVGQLMALEQRPLTAIANKEAKYQAQLSAYASLKGALSSFQSTVASLATPAKFSAVKGTVSDTTVANATVSATAAPGTYSLEVQTLAQSQKLKSATFAAMSTAIGTGKLTLSFGTYAGDTFTVNGDKASKEITIGAGQNSLAGIRDAINAADAGVTAAIVNDGTGYRLTVASADSGTANALRISVTDDDTTNTDTIGLSQLAYDGRTVSGVANLTQSVAASDAVVVIDGITVTKSSNSISDAIEGVTLDLLKVNTPASTTLTIARDTATVQTAVQSFVKAYNDLNKTITDLSKYDSVSKQASILTGESTVRSVQAQMRSVFNAPLSTAGGGLTTLSDVGITFQTDGTLKLDSAKLTAVLNDPSRDVSTLFAAVGKPTDSLISFSSATEDTKIGTYGITVTQVATQGKAVGGAAAALTVTAGVNDTLDLTIDGIAGSLTLAAGTYTAAALAAEIQAKVNGVSAISSARVTVAVTESAGVLTMTSTRYGSASTVALTGGTARADLFGTQVETSGLDVAGSIGSVAATGSGQTLTGAGDASGLALTVTGTSTGDRGTIRYARGYAYQLEKLAAKMLETDSLLDGRISGINLSIKDVGGRRDAMIKRLESVEARYRAQFTALDVLMSRMQQTSTFLSQQLASLPTNN